LPVLCGSHQRLQSYALEVTAAAATQSRTVEKQQGPDRMGTKSAHDAPPHEPCYTPGMNPYLLYAWDESVPTASCQPVTLINCNHCSTVNHNRKAS
jgi:hypothetical protein